MLTLQASLMSMKPNVMNSMMMGQMPALDPKLSMLLEHAPRWMANNSLSGLMQPPSTFLQHNHMGIPGLIDTTERPQFNHPIDGKGTIYSLLRVTLTVTVTMLSRYCSLENARL